MVRFNDRVQMHPYIPNKTVQFFSEHKSQTQQNKLLVTDKIVRQSWPTAETNVERQISIPKREEYAQHHVHVDWSLIPEKLKRKFYRMGLKQEDLHKPRFKERLKMFLR